MKNYKKVSSHGSINIPVAIRRQIGIQGGDAMEVSLDNGVITIKPYMPRCILCGTNENVNYKMHGKYVCEHCVMMEPVEKLRGSES